MMIAASSYTIDNGFMITENKTSYTYLNSIISYEKGIGTKLFREVFRRSLDSGHDGRVELKAASSSHIFHLKMGFVPKERESREDYIQSCFVPLLINIMERNAQNGVLPTTENFGGVDMYLSEEGIERWKADLEGKKPFEPFRRFEPLQNLMTSEQKQKVRSIFGQ